MAGIMDLIAQLRGGGGMPQRPQGVGASMPPQGGMDPSMGGAPPMGGLLSAPPGLEMLNRPAGPDIMSLIRMLTQGSMPPVLSAAQGILGGNGAQPPLPPLDQDAMMAGLGVGGGVPTAASMTEAPAPTPARPAPPKPGPRTRPKKKARPESEDESRAGKMGIKTQKGKAKNKPPKGRSSYEERFASSMKD